jgi:hypothetical protein
VVVKVDGNCSRIWSVRKFPVLCVVTIPTTSEVAMTLVATRSVILAEKLDRIFSSGLTRMSHVSPKRE